MSVRRRDFIALLGGAAAASPQAVEAQQSYQKFAPLLIDLQGWTGQPVGPSSGYVPGDAHSITLSTAPAGRGYVRGNAIFYASISLSRRGGSRITVSGTEVHESTSTIADFEVKTVSTPVFVLIAVTLSPDATFSFIFNKVSEDEAMAIAQRFDWKAVQAALN